MAVHWKTTLKGKLGKDPTAAWVKQYSHMHAPDFKRQIHLEVPAREEETPLVVTFDHFNDETYGLDPTLKAYKEKVGNHSVGVDFDSRWRVAKIEKASPAWELQPQLEVAS